MAKYLLFLLMLLTVPACAQTPLSQTTTFKTLQSQMMNYTGPDSSAIQRLRDSKASDIVSVLDFCPVAQVDGSTDNTTCIQKAVTALCNRSTAGGTLYFPARTYVVNGTITVGCSGVWLEGAGIGDPNSKGIGTRFMIGSGSAPAIVAHVTTSSNGYGSDSSPNNFSYGFGISKMHFDNTTTSRSGAFIDIEGVQQAYIDRVYINGACNALKINGGFNIHVSNFIFETYPNNCQVVQVSGANSAQQTTDVVYFTQGKINAGVGGSCYKITDRVQSVYWYNTQCETGGNALDVSCPTMSSVYQCPGFFVLNDFEAEVFSGSTMNTINITDLADGFKMTDSWLRGYGGGSNAANNLVSIVPSRFSEPIHGLPLTFANNWMKFSGGSCVYLQNEAITFTGNTVYGCGKLQTGSQFGGIELRASRAAVTGNVFCNGDFVNDISWPMPAGITLTNGADYIAITGNVFAGCSTGVASISAGSHVATSGNTGT